MQEAKKILKFWHLMEKPKLIFRAARLSTGRQESDAEHSWRLALMAMVLAPRLKKKVNLEKALKMALVHDIGEIKAGDVPSYQHFFNEDIKKTKQKNELAAMTEIKKMYSSFGKDIFKLWHEYEQQKTFEAKFIKALDKLEARMQIIEGKITKQSRDKIKKAPVLTAQTEKFCGIDPLLIELNNLSKKERLKKYGF